MDFLFNENLSQVNNRLLGFVNLNSLYPSVIFGEKLYEIKIMLFASFIATIPF